MGLAIMAWDGLAETLYLDSRGSEGLAECRFYLITIMLIGALVGTRGSRIWRFVGFGLVLCSMVWMRIAYENEQMTHDEYWEGAAERMVVVEAYGKKAGQYILRDASGKSSTLSLLSVKGLDSLRRGDLIRCELTFRRPSPAIIEGLFDYRLFLRRRGISHTAYAEPGDLELVQRSAISPLQSLRMLISEEIADLYPQQEQAAIVSAFLLGDRSDLGEETQEIFRRTGAMHILAVSGLHVGVIAALMLWLGSRLLPGDRYRHIRGLVAIGFIILFMALTGFSASVSRSGLMFSIYILSGFAFGRQRSGINSLCCAGVILLLLDPFTLYDVGFQYSFAAVLGILLFMPWMKDLWPGGNKILKGLKSVILMSIAAQILIVPLSLLYFGEVSTLGIVSSVAAVPAAAVIMYLSLASVLLGMCYDRLAQIVADVLSMVMDWLFGYINWLSTAEFALYRADYFDTVLVVLWCVAVVGAYLFLVQRIRYFRYLLVCGVMSFSLYSWHQQLDQRDDLYAVIQSDRWGNTSSEIWYHGQRYCDGECSSSWTLDRVAEDLGFSTVAPEGSFTLSTADKSHSMVSVDLSDQSLQEDSRFTAISVQPTFTLYKYEKER